MAWKMDAMIRRCPCLRPKSDDVRTLDFKHCSLADVPNEVFNFERTLEELYLDSNQIHDLPRPLFHCHELRTLGLSDNEIHSLPAAIASLINLEKLDICKNGILDIPDNIKGCKHLRVLEASVNPLGKLPDGFTQLINLEELYLNDTFVDYLPANFGRLTRLKILEVRENHLKSLPKSMSRLTELIRMDIGQNDFRDLVSQLKVSFAFDCEKLSNIVTAMNCLISFKPEVVGHLPKLSELWCDCNRISSLPAFIGNLQVLSYLDASQNRIESIPIEIEYCVNLTDITLSGNNLKSLPETIGCLRNLEILRVDDNNLQKLPNSIGSLSNLEELVLSQNDLRRLPSSIGLLRKMHTFIIDDNLLEELPPEIGSCIKMTVLSARGNRLSVVPDELGHVPHLRIINLSSNQIRYLPFSIAKLRDLQALWLSENQNKPLIPLQGDIDIDTGQRVLTCYLLPQILDDQYDDHHSDSGSFHLSVWEDQRQQRRHIKFAFDEKLDKPGKLVRNPTPYPKELKSHAKHARNQALKNKGANYVNVTSVGDAEQPDVLNEEPIMPVVQEAKVWQVSASVAVREARVTKSRSPNPSPKLHDRLLLYKYDKEKLAKDKARLHHQNTVDDQVVSPTVNPSSIHSRKEREQNMEIGPRNMPEMNSTNLQITSGKYSSLPELLGGDCLPSLNPSLMSVPDESAVKEAKCRRNTSSIIRKLEGLKQGRNNYRDLQSAENDYRSDHDLYANLSQRPQSEEKQELQTRNDPVSKIPKPLKAHDGYASDWEVTVTKRDLSILPGAKPLRLTGNGPPTKSASISAAVARRLNNGTATNRPPLFGSYSRLCGNDFSRCDINSSLNGNSLSFANSVLRDDNNVQNIHKLRNYSSHHGTGTYKNGGQNELHPPTYSLQDRHPTCALNSDSRFAAKLSSCYSVASNSGPPSPVPSLPPRQKVGCFPTVAEKSPPILPPRARPLIYHSVPSTIINSSPQQKNFAPSNVMPPSPNRNCKPPPYHIAATYSKRIGDTSLTERANSAHYVNPSPFPPPTQKIFLNTGNYSPPIRHSALSCKISSPSVDDKLQSTSRNVQISKGRHGSDPSIVVPPSSPSSSSSVSHFRQQSCSSVNGAVVYGNPYTADVDRVDHSPSPQPSRSSSSSFVNCSTGEMIKTRSRQASPYQDMENPVSIGQLAFGTSALQKISPKPELKALSLTGCSLMPQSLSAPSTPPLSDRSPTHLPPYRTPPLYQSASVGSLDSARDHLPLMSHFRFPSNQRHGVAKALAHTMNKDLCTASVVLRPPNYSSVCHKVPLTNTDFPLKFRHGAQSWQNGNKASERLQAQCEKQSELPNNTNISPSHCEQGHSHYGPLRSHTIKRNEDAYLPNDNSWASHALSSVLSHSSDMKYTSQDAGHYGIFTARPVLVDSGTSNLENHETLLTISGNDYQSNICGLKQTAIESSSRSNIYMNPDFTGARHPPNLTQDQPSHNGVGIPLVVPTPQRPAGSGFVHRSARPNDGAVNLESIYESRHRNSAASCESPHLSKKTTPWLFGQHHNPQVIPVVIQKNPDLGFTIALGQNSPIKRNESAICVASVTPEGAASSVLKPGDKLLQVDGKDFTHLDLNRANQLLDDTGSVVFMMVSRVG